MLVGLAVALLLASQMPFLEPVFATSNQAWAILGGATIVCLLGVADDIWDLDWITKLVGQILAAGFIAWQGVQLVTLPIAGTTIGSSRLSLILTVLVIVVAMNAVNWVDGLDGLAAGVIAIGGAAFFVYTYLLTTEASPGDYSDLATMVLAALVGACLGFLPHNFFPARIFMGDSGAMMLGLVVASTAIVVTGDIDAGTVSQREQFPAFLPIVLPFAVLLVPLVDVLVVVVRRVAAGKAPWAADNSHLHHRLMARGHSHRRTVVILYMWTFLVAFGAASLAVLPTTTVLVLLGVGVAIATFLSVVPLPVRRRRRRPPVPVP